MASDQVREYRAIVWTKDPQSVGKRVTLLARSLEDAEGTLKAEHGEDIVYTLWNEDDANKPR